MSNMCQKTHTYTHQLNEYGDDQFIDTLCVRVCVSVCTTIRCIRREVEFPSKKLHLNIHKCVKLFVVEIVVGWKIRCMVGEIALPYTVYSGIFINTIGRVEISDGLLLAVSGVDT